MEDYLDTLILVAPDSPVTTSVVPTPHRGKPTVATIQYELLAANPGRFTQGELLLATWLTQQGYTELSEPLFVKHRDEFFAKSRACLRASPLPKQFGWGLRYDAAGRVTLCAMESAAYQALAAGDESSVTLLRAMRRARV